jgi:hypothetical protein
MVRDRDAERLIAQEFVAAGMPSPDRNLEIWAGWEEGNFAASIAWLHLGFDYQLERRMLRTKHPIEQAAGTPAGVLAEQVVDESLAMARAEWHRAGGVWPREYPKREFRLIAGVQLPSSAN